MTTPFDILGRPPKRRMRDVQDPLPPLEEDPAFQPVSGKDFAMSARFGPGGNSMSMADARSAQHRSLTMKAKQKGPRK